MNSLGARFSGQAVLEDWREAEGCALSRAIITTWQEWIARQKVLS
jgi:hypothetical protein